MNIFLIDDEYISNFINRKLIEHIDSSVYVTEFSNPEVAYGKLPASKPDLIFLDINMPVMNGWDFLGKMANDGIKINVIILTSSVNNIDRKMAKKYKNVIGYIEKPATIATITPYIIKMLAQVA